MHLTNYAINKHSENFVRDEDTGSKRKLSSFKKHLEAMCYDTEKMWRDFEDIIIKTLISAHPILKHNYHTCFPNHASGSACFEILGFDVLLDHRLKPWLLEVNHSPSFTTDSRLDREVKDGLLYDTLVLINLGACDRRKITEEEKRRVKERLQQNRSREARNEEIRQSLAASIEQMQKYEAKNMGGFRRIFPREGGDQYEKYFQHSSSLFQETAASKAREECARQQLQDLRLKQEQKEREKKGSRKQDLQGESAGERAKPKRILPPHQNPKVQPTTLDQTTLRGETPVALDVIEEEEAERLGELHQRETLLQNMGVVNQVRQLLQSANHLSELIKHSHEQASLSRHCRHEHKLDSIAEMSWRQKNICTNMQQVSTKAKPCLQRDGGVKCRTPASAGQMKAASARRIPFTICGSFSWRQSSMSSSLAESRARASMLGVPPLVPRRGAGMLRDPKSLFVISIPAPLVPRPHLSHAIRKAPRRVPPHDHSH
ncbi:tubulin polyglutamylase TTLL6 [Pimephales promelas]|nr:tubulin polyglutamylase TTLL6 [Pimephales promelas]